MVKRGHGKIVNSVLDSRFGGPCRSVPFTARPNKPSKHWWKGLTIELHGTGVEACTINPVCTKTGFNDRGEETMGAMVQSETTLANTATMESVTSLLSDQLDPQEQVDDLVRVIEVATFKVSKSLPNRHRTLD
jgi:hypothetical protein